MKNLITKIASVAAVCIAAFSLAAPANAQQAFNMKVNVPFSFIAGDRSLPAGDYRIHVDGRWAVMDLLAAGETRVYRLTINGFKTSKGSAAPNDGFLRFARYGESYVLRGAWNMDTRDGYELPISKAEAEMAKVSGGGTSKVVSAVR